MRTQNLTFLVLLPLLSLLLPHCKQPSDNSEVKLSDNLHYIDKVTNGSTKIPNYRQIDQDSCLVEVKSRFKPAADASDPALAPVKTIGNGGCLPSNNLAFRGRVDISRERKGNIRVALLIDNTGSLSISDPGRRRWDGVAKFLDTLKANFQGSGASLVVKVIFFNYCTLPFSGSDEHDYGQSIDDSSFRQRIKSKIFQKPTGYTNYLGALNKAVDWLGGYVNPNNPAQYGGSSASSPGATGHVVLFTDGMPYVFGDDISPSCKLGSQPLGKLPYLTLKDSTIAGCIENTSLSCSIPKAVGYQPGLSLKEPVQLNPYNFVIGFSQHLRDFNYLHQNSNGILVQGIFLTAGDCGEEKATRGRASNSVFKTICRPPTNTTASCADDPLSCPANRHTLMRGITKDNYFMVENANLLLQSFESAAKKVIDEEIQKLNAVRTQDGPVVSHIESQRCRAGAVGCEDKDAEGFFNFFLEKSNYTSLTQEINMAAFTAGNDQLTNSNLAMQLRFNPDLALEDPTCGFSDVTNQIFDPTTAGLHQSTFLRKNFGSAGQAEYRITCHVPKEAPKECVPGHRKLISSNIDYEGQCPNKTCFENLVFEICTPEGKLSTETKRQESSECANPCSDCEGLAEGEVRDTSEIRYKDATVCSPNSCEAEAIKEQCVNGALIRIEPTFNYTQCSAQACETPKNCDGQGIGERRTRKVFERPEVCKPETCVPKDVTEICTEDGWVGPNIFGSGKGADNGTGGYYLACIESDCVAKTCSYNGRQYRIGETVDERQQCQEPKVCANLVGEGLGSGKGDPKCTCWTQTKVCGIDGKISEWAGGFGATGHSSCQLEDCFTGGKSCGAIPDGSYDVTLCYKNDCKPYLRKCENGALNPQACGSKTRCAPCNYQGATYRQWERHPPVLRYRSVDRCVRSKADSASSCQPRLMTRMCHEDPFTGQLGWSGWKSEDRYPLGRSDDNLYNRTSAANCYCGSEILPPPILPPIPTGGGKGKGQGKEPLGAGKQPIFPHQVPIIPVDPGQIYTPASDVPGFEPIGLNLTNPEQAEPNSPLSGVVGQQINTK